MLDEIKCFFGFHNVTISEKWTPSIDAEIVTNFEAIYFCKNCNKVLGKFIFNENDL